MTQSRADLPDGRGLRRLAEICFSMAAGIAFLVLLAWALGRWRIAALGSEYVAMAPSTAVLFLMLSGAALLRSRRPSACATKRLGYVVVVVSVAMSLLVWAQFLSGFETPVERWLSRTTEKVGQVPLGRMSPLTALTFLLISLAFLFELRPFAGRKMLRQVAAALALLVLLCSLVVALGYALGAPLLYGGSVVPMATLTAVSSALVGLGLLVVAGTDTWPLSLFTSEPPSTVSLQSKRSELGGLFLVFLLLGATIGTTGFFYLKNLQAIARRTVQRELAAIADLKVKQISDWRSERLADANLLFNSSFFTNQVREFLADPAAQDVRRDILAWLGALQAANEYERVLLLDAQLNVRFASPASAESFSEQRHLLAADALRGRRVAFSNVYRSPETGSLHIDMAAPLLVRDVQPAETGAPADFPLISRLPPVGLVLFEIDLRTFIFPLIESWPTPSDTAETLLVRREGDEVVFLNDLRHRKHTALALRLPVTQGRLPAAMAVAGQEGVVEGIDYRGVPVLAAVRAVPDTAWFMVAKIDQTEAYAALRHRIWAVGIIAVSLVAAACLVVVLLWSRRSAHFLRLQLKIERERQVLNERIVHLTQYAHDIVLMMDGEFNILDANERAREAYGYSLDELRRMNVLALRAPEARADFEKQVSAAEARGGAILETKHQRKDGSTFPVEASFRAVEVDGQQIYQSIIRDITERRRVEDALRTSEARFRRVSESAPVGIFEADRDGAVSFLNDRWCAITGLSREDALGFGWAKALHPEDAPRMQAEWAECLKEKKQYSGEFRFRRPGGEVRWVFSQSTPIFSASGEVIGHVGANDDITERKRAEELLAQQAEDLVRSNADLQQFAYAASHDLQEPLRTVGSFAELLARRYRGRLDADADEFIGFITDAVGRMQAMIRGLLEYSRVSTRELTIAAVDCRAVVEEVLDDLRAIIVESGTEITVDSLRTVEADRVQLRRIFQNLVGNAIKFRRQDEPLRIHLSSWVMGHESCAPQSGTSERMTHDSCRMTVFAVRDNGIGIAPQDQERIFGFFQRLHTSAEYPGAGIGLATCKKIVERHGGRIWVESKPGEGSTFFFTVPGAE